MLFIGIDPGINGGIACLSALGAVVSVVKMPSTERDLFQHLSGLRPSAQVEDRTRHAVLERAQSMPRQGVHSTFVYGQGYGALLMGLTACEIPFDLVHPTVWQGAMCCRSKGNKNVTKRRAQQLFPRVKVTHAIADALLLAEFCRQRHLPAQTSSG